jgi:hypothetical protein
MNLGIEKSILIRGVGTMFIALTDMKVPVTAFNLSMINPHVAAGPFLYQAG